MAGRLLLPCAARMSLTLLTSLPPASVREHFFT